MLGNVFHLLYVIHFHSIKHAWSFTNFRISTEDDPHLQHLALTMVIWRTGSYYTKRKIRSFMYLAFMCHKSLSEYQSRHSNIKQEHDSSGALLCDKDMKLLLWRASLGRWNMAGTGERHGRGSSVPSFAGETVVLKACSIESSGKTCYGDAILTSLATLPVTPIETRFPPVFTTLAYCTNWTKDQLILACRRVFFYFILFPDVGNKAIVNVSDFNGGNKLFSKCNISLYLYSLEKCNAKFPKNLLNVISAVTESPVNARA